jgi:hypothetical protein
MLQPLLGLADSWDVPGLDPPQRHKGALELLEPFAAAAHHGGMGALVDIRAQSVQRFPDRHVHNDEIVVERAQAGGIVALACKPPYKAGAALGQRIDLVELGHKIGHQRAFKRRAHARDIDLGEVVGG